jgi:hypothetical protein
VKAPAVSNNTRPLMRNPQAKSVLDSNDAVVTVVARRGSFILLSCGSCSGVTKRFMR